MAPFITAAALDTETTGLQSSSDHIIEIAIQLFRFDPATGRIMEKLQALSTLHDPGVALSPEIQSVTCITPLMLAGHRIDWNEVDRLLGQAELIIAHNAQFDRGFVDRLSRVSPTKVWGCSSRQVNWRDKGFKNARLQDLCAALGITHQAHRAMGDVQAMLELLSREDPFTSTPYLCELFTSARQEMVYVWVAGKTYDQRDLLKAHGFRWNGVEKAWGKLVSAAENQSQIEAVAALVPGTTVRSRPVPPADRFKA